MNCVWTTNGSFAARNGQAIFKDSGAFIPRPNHTAYVSWTPANFDQVMRIKKAMQSNG